MPSPGSVRLRYQGQQLLPPGEIWDQQGPGDRQPCCWLSPAPISTVQHGDGGVGQGPWGSRCPQSWSPHVPSTLPVVSPLWSCNPVCTHMGWDGDPTGPHCCEGWGTQGQIPKTSMQIQGHSSVPSEPPEGGISLPSATPMSSGS